MFKGQLFIIAFLAGIVLTVFVFLGLRGCSGDKDPEVINKDYYILSNQISKMNKMVVLEQDFSSFQTHKSSAFNVAGFDVLPKEMVLYTTAKAQVSYDLAKMQVKVDSTKKELTIEKLPNPEVKIYPEVKVHFMDDYAVNRFDQESINSVMESAKKNVVKSIDQEKLKSEGKKQLMNNLSEIFVLAKALDYKIVDKTGQVGEFRD